MSLRSANPRIAYLHALEFLEGGLAYLSLARHAATLGRRFTFFGGM